MGSFPETYNDPQLLPGRIKGHPPSRVSFSERSYEKQFSRLCPSQQLSRILRLPRLDRVDLLGKPKC